MGGRFGRKVEQAKRRIRLVLPTDEGPRTESLSRRVGTGEAWVSYLDYMTGERRGRIL